MEGPLGQATGGTPGLADHLARGGIIEDVSIENVQTSGDVSRVTVVVTYDEAALARRNAGATFPEDNPVRQVLPLVREDGSWKISADYLRGYS
jgi:hypothetical protein